MLLCFAYLLPEEIHNTEKIHSHIICMSRHRLNVIFRIFQTQQHSKLQ